MIISALIVDDEKFARARLRRMLSKYENIEVVGEAQNGQEGLKLVKATHPDVIFLDIKMPMISGFEMLKLLDKSPYIIFTTVYDQYALQAFEENTVDYLLKPISDRKLDRAISKLSKILQQGNSINIDLERLLKSIEEKKQIIKRFSVKLGDRIFLIPANEIYFFHAEDKYTFLSTGEKDFIISLTLKELEKRLDPEKFLRVHRAYIINLEYIKSIHSWFGGKMLVKMKNGREIVVTRHYLNDFKERTNM